MPNSGFGLSVVANDVSKLETMPSTVKTGGLNPGQLQIHQDKMLANVGQKTMLSQFARSLFQRMPRAKRVLLRAHQAIFGERDEWRRQAHFWKYYADLYAWRWRSVAAELWGEPIRPLACKPPPIRDRKTESANPRYGEGFFSKLLGEQWADGTQPQNHPLIYTDAEVDACIARIGRGETSIYSDTDKLLWAALGRYPIMGKSVAVMGSISPWYEATCIHFGARPTTIDHNPIISKSSRLEAITVAEHHGSPCVFDCAVSISSFEHDGLGMYGDPIDSDGDLKAMQNMRRLVAPRGLLFLSIPVGRDALNFNVRRIYGRLRLPLMLRGWETVETFGFQDDLLDIPSAVEPVFVLRNS
jgi:hypothetical protein